MRARGAQAQEDRRAGVCAGAAGPAAASGSLLRYRRRLSDSNRTILAAKELRLITQILVRRLINPVFDATLRKARHGHLNSEPHTSEGHHYNHRLIKWLGTE